MRLSFLALAGALTCALLMGGQAPPSSRTPGPKKPDKLLTPAAPPPQQTLKLPPPDPAQLQREAKELASLAQLLPSEFHDVASGRLPKDLIGQLKRIEKLSKELRRGVAP